MCIILIILRLLNCEQPHINTAQLTISKITKYKCIAYRALKHASTVSTIDRLNIAHYEDKFLPQLTNGNIYCFNRIYIVHIDLFYF